MDVINTWTQWVDYDSPGETLQSKRRPREESGVTQYLEKNRGKEPHKDPKERASGIGGKSENQKGRVEYQTAAAGEPRIISSPSLRVPNGCHSAPPWTHSNPPTGLHISAAALLGPVCATPRRIQASKLSLCAWTKRQTPHDGLPGPCALAPEPFYLAS